MATRKRQGRARRGTGSIVQRGDRYMAQIDLGRDRTVPVIAGATRSTRAPRRRRGSLEVRTHSQELTTGVADQRLADYLRWWIDNEAPKGKPGRPPLADDPHRLPQQHRTPHHPGTGQRQGR
jgi:hypothetical protein